MSPEETRCLLEIIQVKEYLTVKEAAFLLNCSERHLLNLVAKAKTTRSEDSIPFGRLGRKTVFHRKKLLEWVEKN